MIRVRFAIRVGGLYTQNIVHFPGDLLLGFYPSEQVPHELLVAFKYAVDVLMQTTKDDVHRNKLLALVEVAARFLPVRWRTL